MSVGDAYDGIAKMECPHKISQNKILQLIATKLAWNTEDIAIVLDDDKMASSNALINAGITPASITVFNYGDMDKITHMREMAPGVQVYQADAHMAVHHIKSDNLRLAYLDFCCTSKRIILNGTLPAIMARICRDGPSVISITWSRRSTDSAKLMFDAMLECAKTHYFTSHIVYEDKYRMHHATWIIIPRDAIMTKDFVVEIKTEISTMMKSFTMDTKDIVKSKSKATIAMEDVDYDSERLYSYRNIMAVHWRGKELYCQIEWEEGSITWEPAHVIDDAYGLARLVELTTG